ncbi:hypothetical protein Ciccas_010474 [Cichlidogyrus casuarinus]|uniref:Nuclear transport factor 2 domain-containing protein n=1 Tax=Cichlidogyrus casuarinus TaxID=1844966 RepID=A0ABD2PU08_9PLAT
MEYQEDIPVKDVHARFNSLSNKRKKKQEKVLKKEFAQKCVESLTTEPLAIDLPQSKPVGLVSSAILNYLQQFIGKYLDIYDNPTNRVQLQDFYSDDAVFALQSAHLTNPSYIKHLAKREPICPIWQLYEPFAVNDLDGNCPLPSWALFTRTQSLEPKISGQQHVPKINLNKNDRANMKVFRGIIDHRKKELISKDRSLMASDEWKRIDIPRPPAPRSIAKGKEQIMGLLCRMPPCKHVRSDTCCQVDVPIATPAGIVMRFSCLMVEALPLSIVEKMHPSSNIHVLIFGKIGAAAVRLVQRTMIIDPEPVNKIVQEDMTILPAPLPMINTHSDAIKLALFGESPLEPQLSNLKIHNSQ